MSQVATGTLLSLENTIAKNLFAGKTYPYEVLPHIGDFILELQRKLSVEEFDVLEETVYIHKTAKVAKTACICGPCIIDADAEVRHGAFIRGNAIIGKGAVVGNSTEIKNAVLFDKVQVPHYNYVGDSILGYRAHMGAGTIASNLKADKSLVTVCADGQRLETGLKKFGAILGDCVDVGCNSVLNPGTVIGKNSVVYPLSSVRGFIPADSICKGERGIVKKR